MAILADLFIVSAVKITAKSNIVSEAEWIYDGVASLTGLFKFSQLFEYWLIDSLGSEEISIKVMGAIDSKCPRCWTYRAEAEGTTCTRCTAVVKE